MKPYDYSKLLGRMREKHFTQESLARQIGISETSLNQRLNNALSFKQDDMWNIMKALEINPHDIEAYFFTHVL